MATSTDSIPGQDYVDFDEYIDIQLRKTGSNIKTTDVLTSVVGISTLITLYLLVFVICDHWVISGGFSAVSRAIMLAIVLVASIAWLVIQVVLPWRRRVSGLYAASTIEKASPGLKSSLLNLADLSRTGRDVHPAIYSSIERRAALALSHVDVNEAVDRRSLLRLSLSLLAIVVAFCLYWILSPKNPATSLWRALAPMSRDGVATRTEIFSVRPGDTDIIARSQLEVTADLGGVIPPQTFLYFTTADHKFVDERIEMRLQNESAKQFRCVITGENGAGILQNMTYRIVAGDATTQDYKIRMIQPPAAAIESITLDYPEYTRLPRTMQTTGPIDALEGTRVTLKAAANMPIRSASLQFFDDETASKRAEEIPIHITDATKLQLEWKLEIRSDHTSPHYYRIFCTNAAGESDPNPSLYSLAIRPDQAPEITLRDPKADLEMPANAVVPLVIEARDPDFSLRYINLKLEKDGSAIIGPPILEAKGTQQQFKTTYNWQLKDYHFRPKETISYYVQAQDNRQPNANVANTPKLRIHIVDPVSEDQVKKNLEKAQQRQKEEAQKADNEAGSEQKRDEDQENADADKNQRKESTQDSKRKTPEAAQEQRQPKDANKEEKEDSQNAENERGKDQDGSGDSGGQKKGQTDKGKQGGNDSESGSNGENRQQQLNPDDPADDSKVLSKLHELSKDDSAKDKEEGSQDKGAENKSPEDQGAGDKQPKPPNKDDKKNSGSENGQSKDGSKKDEKPGDKGSKQDDGKAADSKTEQGQTGDKQENSKSGDKNKSADPGAKADQQKGSQEDSSKERTGANPGAQKKPEAQKESNDNPSKDKSGSKADEQQGGKNDASKEKAGSKPEDQKGAKEGSSDKQNNKKPDEPLGKKPGSSADKNQDGSTAKDDSPKNPKGDSPKDDSQNRPKNDGANPDGSPNSKDKADKDKNSNDGGASLESKGQDNGQKPDEQNNGGSKGDQSKSDQSQGDKNSGQSDDSKQKSGAQGDSTDVKKENENQKPNDKQEKGASKQNDKSGQKGDVKDDAKSQPGAKNGQKSDPKDRNQQQSDSAKQDAGAQKKDGDKTKKSMDKASQSDLPEKKDATEQKGKPDGKRPDDQRVEDRKLDPNDVPKGKQAPRDDQQKNNADDSKISADRKAREERPKMTKEKTPPQQGDDGSEKTNSSDSRKSTSQKDAGQRGSDQKRSEAGKAPPQSDAQQKDSQGEASKKSGQEGASQEKQGKDGQPQESQGEKGDSKEGSQSGGKESGEQGKDGKGQEGKGQDGKASGKQSGSAKGSSQSGSGPSGGGAGDAKGGGGGGHNNGTGPGAGESLKDTSGDANLDYAKKATDLVLNRLDKQLKRGKVDKKVLEELGWTEDQVRRFVERIKNQVPHGHDLNSPTDEARRLQFEETLRSLNLSKSGQKRSGLHIQKSQGMEIQGKRSIPPPEYRELYDAFTKSLANDKKK